MRYSKLPQTAWEREVKKGIEKHRDKELARLEKYRDLADSFNYEELNKAGFKRHKSGKDVYINTEERVVIKRPYQSITNGYSIFQEFIVPSVEISRDGYHSSIYIQPLISLYKGGDKHITTPTCKKFRALNISGRVLNDVCTCNIGRYKGIPVVHDW